MPSTIVVSSSSDSAVNRARILSTCSSPAASVSDSGSRSPDPSGSRTATHGGRVFISHRTTRRSSPLAGAHQAVILTVGLNTLPLYATCLLLARAHRDRRRGRDQDLLACDLRRVHVHRAEDHGPGTNHLVPRGQSVVRARAHQHVPHGSVGDLDAAAQRRDHDDPAGRHDSPRRRPWTRASA